MADEDKKIAAIVVTYNRKELLANCLKAICSQEYKPQCVYIVDNASTDGTAVWIKQNGYDGNTSGIDFRYVLLSNNIGGAGGFYTGLKMAHESAEQYDAFWMMDDDGMPEKSQLKIMVEWLNRKDYISPNVVLKEDPTKCAMVDYTVEGLRAESKDGVLYNAANPFNGVLLSKKLVDVVGYPVKDMFIWGDEINYGLRCIKAGYSPVLIMDAIHFHPKNRQTKVSVFQKSIGVPSPNWKLYLLIRNAVYNAMTLSRTRHVVKVVAETLFYYTFYYMFFSPAWQNLKVVYRAVFDGLNKDLSRLSAYKK